MKKYIIIGLLLGSLAVNAIAIYTYNNLRKDNEALMTDNKSLRTVNGTLLQRISELETELEQRPVSYTPWRSLGTYDITAYVSTGNKTKAETWPVVGRTVGAYLPDLPLGTLVYIEGMGEFTVEDTGSAARPGLIDYYIGDSEQEAIGFGRQQRQVFIKEIRQNDAS